MKYRPERICPYINDRGLCIFLIILLSYTIIFTAIAIWRYENFLIQESGDLLLFEQFIYNTLHGRLFYASSIGNQFAYHNSPILFILVPFAAIIPVPYVLYASTVLCITVSAIPIYLISREELKDEKLAVLLGACYIMLPGLVGQVYQSFHEINLVLPFLTFSFYYFVKERFYPFLIMFVLGLMVKEDVSVTLFMFSIYAIIKKKDMKWYIFPAVSSLTWLLFSIKVVIPFFNKSLSYPMISYFSDLGSSFSEVIKNVFFNPRYILYRSFLPHKISYLYALFMPVGLVLPFLSIEILFIIPSIFLNLLAESSRFRVVEQVTAWGTVLIPRHMSLFVSVFLFISALYSIKKVGSLFIKQEALIKFFLSLLIAFSTLYSDRFIIVRDLYQTPSYVTSTDSIKKVLSDIPIHATVKADRRIATHLYNRKEVYTSESLIDTDYIVLTGGFYVYVKVAKKNRQASPNYSDAISRDDLLLLNNIGKPVDAGIREKYDLMVAEKGVALFKKRGGNPQ